MKKLNARYIAITLIQTLGTTLTLGASNTQLTSPVYTSGSQLTHEWLVENCAPYKSVLRAGRSLAFTKVRRPIVVRPSVSQRGHAPTSSAKPPGVALSPLTVVGRSTQLARLHSAFWAHSARPLSCFCLIQKGSPSGQPVPVCFQCEPVPQRQQQRCSPNGTERRKTKDPALILFFFFCSCLSLSNRSNPVWTVRP